MQKIETVDYELQSLTAQEQESLQKRAELAHELSEIETCEQQLQSHVVNLTTQLEDMRHQRESASMSLTETKVLVASEEQVCASLLQQQQPLQQRIGELRHLAEERRNEIGGFATRKEQWLAEIDESRRQIERLKHEREIVNAQAAELISQKIFAPSGVVSLSFSSTVELSMSKWRRKRWPCRICGSASSRNSS